MKASKVTVEDIRSIGSYGTISVELPSYTNCRTAVNVMNYVKKAYPREDGLSYYSRIIGNTITIGTADVDKIHRKMTIDEIKDTQYKRKSKKRRKKTASR